LPGRLTPAGYQFLAPLSPCVQRARRLIHFALLPSEQSRNLVDSRNVLANSGFRNRFNHLFEITGNLDQFGFRHLNHLSPLENEILVSSPLQVRNITQVDRVINKLASSVPMRVNWFTACVILSGVFSGIPLQLPLALMRLFAVGLEFQDHAAVQRLQHANARQPVQPPPVSAARIKCSTAICHISRSCSAFGSLVMQVAASLGVSSFRPSGQGDRSFERRRPWHQANSSAPVWVNFTKVPRPVDREPAALDGRLEASAVPRRRPCDRTPSAH